MSNPTVKILAAVDQRNVTTKTGAVKPVYSQKAEVECDQLRTQIDVEVDGPNLGYKVGEVFEWDVVADLAPGQYGRIELARRMTLRPRGSQVASK